MAAMLGLGGCRATTPSGAPVAEPVAGVLGEASCVGDDAQALHDCVSAERYAEHLRQVVGMRPTGSPHWARVQHLCDATLSGLGFDVERHEYGTGTNVLGVRRGDRWPDERVVVGAHYDHIPGCAGADDNATGVAGALELARVLSSAPQRRTLVVACWDEEEQGLRGSRAWAARARERGERIVVYFNFDAIGFVDRRPGAQRIPAGFSLLFPEQVEALQAQGGRADFITIVTDAAALPHAQGMAEAAQRDGLPHTLLAIPTLVQRTHIAIDLQRSDHAALWDEGYPAIMITDTAEYRSGAYHCREQPDTLDRIDVPFAAGVVAATAYAVALALNAPAQPDAAAATQPDAAAATR